MLVKYINISKGKMFQSPGAVGQPRNFRKGRILEANSRGPSQQEGGHLATCLVCDKGKVIFTIIIFRYDSTSRIGQLSEMGCTTE